MKKSLLITLLGIFVAGAALAQSEETRSLSSFSEISAHEGIDVFIKAGDKEEARIVSDSHDLDEVLTEVSGGRLKIHLEGNNHRNIDVDVYVTYKSINAISASSAASLTAEGTIDANGSDFDIDRKKYPVYTGVLKYFPDALMEVSRVSLIGNEQHHAGKPLHWDKTKSTDHLDALTRHLLDADKKDDDGMLHLAKVAWRALAALQDRLEKDK